MIQQTCLPPYPNGWYVAAFSSQLKPGAPPILQEFMGQEIALYRTQSGRACVVDAFCPHLGANFAYGGRVQGELLQCPFHGFEYDPAGNCVRTGYGTPVPPTALLHAWTTCEQNGMLQVYYDSRSLPPAWTIPPVEQAGWSPLVHAAFRLHDHPQETTENSVDLGHFAFVHHYEDVRSLRDLQTAGPYLSTVYAVRRRIPFISSLVRSARIGFEFETHIYGLGYSLVNVRFPSLPVNARLWVLPTPSNQDHLILRFAVMTYCDSTFLRPLNPLFARLMLAGLSHDARQDFPIWEHKRYTHPPALARGDGPIGKYRQWAKQFYA